MYRGSDLISNYKEEVNDINNPLTWVLDAEIPFGNGLFGYRMTGYIEGAAYTMITTEITPVLPLTSRLVRTGGWWKNAMNSNVRHVLGTIYNTGIAGTVTSSSSVSYSANSQTFVFQSYSGALRTGTLDNEYDIWIKYRK